MSDERLLLDSYLKMLKLPTIRAEYKALARKCSQANAAYEDFLQQLAELEVQRRTAVAIERRLRQAGFPMVKEMSSYKFADVPKLNKKYVLDLARCQFIETKTNLVLTGSPEYKGSRNIGSESYDPGKLEWNTIYYWRIDEVNNANADSPWKGNIWSFTTADFLVVDDFESYNDLNEDEPGSNRIFNAWIDGLDNPAINGSIVGYGNPPFTERSIVHGGKQSMPFAYDNGVGKSEATLTLTYNNDWTVNGVDTLTVWYRGNASNAAETIYVTLNGSAKLPVKSF